MPQVRSTTLGPTERDARRPVPRDGGTGGLLEPVAGEVHPRRVVAELRGRAAPELDLAERRRDPLGLLVCAPGAVSRSCFCTWSGVPSAAVAAASSA